MKRHTIIVWYTILLILVVSGLPRMSFSQTNCSQVLVDAQNMFEDGKINEIPEFLDPCLTDGFTKEEKIEAYKLLSMVYTFMDEDENADQHQPGRGGKRAASTSTLLGAVLHPFARLGHTLPGGGIADA